MNDWFTTFVFMYCLLLVIGFSAHWLTGCVNLPWTPPVRLLDRSITVLFRPLIILFILVKVSFITRVGIVKTGAFSHSIKNRKKLGNLTSLSVASYPLVLVIVSFWVLFMVPAFPACTGTPKAQAYAIAAAPDWAQLADFPPSAVFTVASPSPGKYEPTFYLVFQANEQEIQAWVSDSPGIKDVVPEVWKNTINGIEYLKYDIFSQENRNIAVVLLTPDRREVIIRPGDNSQRGQKQSKDTDSLD